MELQSELLKRLKKEVDLSMIRLPSPRRTKHKRKQRTKSKSYTSPKLSPKRMPSSPSITVCYPTNRAFNTHSSTKEIGPGQYDIVINRDTSTGYFFATTPRFSSSLKERIENYSTLLSHDDHKAAAKVDLGSYKPDVRKFIMEESARLRAQREVTVKRAREEYEEKMSQVRTDNFKKKAMKIELVSRGGEVLYVKHSWLTLMTLMAWTKIARRLYVERADLRRRSERLLKLVFYYTIIIGRLRIRLRALRVKRSLRVFRRHAHLFKSWLKTRRTLHTNAIVGFLDRALVSPILVKLFVNWKVKVVVLQKVMKSWSVIRKAKSSPRRKLKHK
mmetsp:Transcript_24696/g.43521  ORF Transcript_24696/g.43521 Transcript_24696/m.43521 type:complete len:331 (+) Transcript_24696:68-1060(+)